jgi:DNA-binding NarL/FixJ family response regulator
MTFLQQRWPRMLGPKPKEAMQEIEQEIKNIRAAWRWAVDHRLEAGIEKGLDSLWFFYDTRSWYREGHKAFARAAAALRDSPPDNPLILGKILARQGVLSASLYWGAEATALLEESLAIFRRLDNRREIAFALARLGEVASYTEHYTEARKHFEDSFALYEEIGDRWEQAYALNWLGHMIRDLPQQLALRKRCLAIFQELNSQWGVAIATVSLGQSALYMGDYDEALRLGQIGYGLSQEIDIQWNVIVALRLLGGTAYKTGKYLEAKWCFEQALQMALDVQLTRLVRHSATWMARVLLAMGHQAQAMELYAIALRYAEDSAAQLHLERIKAELSSENLAAVIARSHEIAPESAIRALLADLERLDEAGEDEDEAVADVPLPVSSQSSIDSLTERELEILRLVAEGKSNRDIAAELVLALGTVKWYISQIFSKLGAASRTQAVARARELSLLQ